MSFATYDDWKLATPPEYDEDAREPDEAECPECGGPATGPGREVVGDKTFCSPECAEKDRGPASTKPSNCLDCPYHKVLPDPDPDDWFCDDDVKVVCVLAGCEVTSSCRPYKTREESEVPRWCPLSQETR